MSDAVSEGGEDEVFLGGCVGVKEGVGDVGFSEEILVPGEAARLLGVCVGGVSLVDGGMDCSVETIHEEMVGGREMMLNVVGTCGDVIGEEKNRDVRSASDKCRSRDNESAMIFSLPGMCSENKLAPCLNNILAKYLANLSCCVCCTGLNVEW